MPTQRLNLRGLLTERRPLVAHFVFEFATPGIGYLIANAGADFAVLDMEHSARSFESAKLTVLAARAAALPLVVRLPSKDAKDVARACDIGADGIMAPMVESADEAREIVAAVKFAPEGRRGIGQLQMHDYYRAGPFMDKAAAANSSVAIFLQIESRQGVDSARAIASVPGVDGLWLGHMDLSCSLGAAAQFDTPAFASAVRKLVDAARACNCRIGRMARDAEEGEMLHKSGFNCIALGGDTQVYQTALSNGITALRRQIGA